LDEEELLQKKLQGDIQQMQLKHLGQEHKLLHSNLNIIQGLLETFFEEEVHLRKKLAPLEAEEQKQQLKEKINKIMADEEKIINEAKAREQAEYDALVKKHEEELAKFQGSLEEISKEDRKKAFLTKKFNIHLEPPSRNKLDIQLVDLEARFEAFKSEKAKTVEEQSKMLIAVNPKEDEDINEQRQLLKQTHTSREEKLLQIQNEEKSKFEKMIEESNKQQGEPMQQRRKDLKEEEEKDRAIAMQPPLHQGDEQQDEDDDD